MTTTSHTTNTETPPPNHRLTASVHPPPQNPHDTAGTEEQGTPQKLIEHARRLRSQVAALKQKGSASITGDLTCWLSAQFVAAGEKAAAQATDGCIELKILHALTIPIVHLRIGDQNAERLAIISKRLELDIGKYQRNRLEQFLKWNENEKVKKLEMTDESYAEKIELLGQELFGEDWRD